MIFNVCLLFLTNILIFQPEFVNINKEVIFLIKREEYLSKLNKFKNKDLIKVVSGIRRSGKSTLFQLFIDDLKLSGVTDNQIITINFENPDFRHLATDPFALYDHIKTLIDDKQNYYIFLDEIQEVKAFEKAVDGLYLKKNLDIYITGSNAYFLSGELATYLTGRYITIEILPLSFNEFLAGVVEAKPNLSSEQYYVEYLKSAFPYALYLETDEEKRIYLSSLIDTILLNDVVPRVSATNVSLLKRILSFLFDSIGSEISINKIATVLSNRGEGKVYPKMVDKYLQGLLDALLLYKASRYDLKGKQILLGNEKYYAVDEGLRKVMLGNSKNDTGHILENIVFLELKRRGYEVFVGKIGDYEIDFVARNDDKLEYYQVAATVLDSNTLARELRPFEELRDGYQRFLLTLDVIGAGSNYDGVKQVNVLEWLRS